MSLSDELLATANYLLRQNNKRPSDAATRRAISTAYYALFHHLIEAATASLVTAVGQRHALARSFDHGKMRRICEAMKSASSGLAAILGSSVSNELKQVAAAFVELQDRRHDADYNLARTFAKAEAQDFVAQAEEAFANWATVQPTVIAGPFLLLLLHGEPKGR